jgi:hypothetical protein
MWLVVFPVPPDGVKMSGEMKSEAAPAIFIIVILCMAAICGGIVLMSREPGLPKISPDRNYSIQVTTRYSYECGEVYLEYRPYIGVNRFGEEVYSLDKARINLGRADEFNIINTMIRTPKGNHMELVTEGCMLKTDVVAWQESPPRGSEFVVTELP